LLNFDDPATDFEDLQDSRNHLQYRLFFWIGSGYIALFALVNLIDNRLDLARVLGLMLVVFVIVNIFLLKTSNLRLAGNLYTAALVYLVWYLVWHGGVSQTGPLWVYPIIVVTIANQGARGGMVLAGILVLISFTMMKFGFPLSPQVDYDPVFQNRFLATMTALVVLTWGIEFSRDRAYRILHGFSQRLEQASLTDQLTGLLNRRGLESQFNAEAGRFSRTGKTFSMLLIDLDDFKAVNDGFGHNAGDQVLRDLGAMMQQQIRHMDTLARWGGEEFVILLSHATHEDAIKAAEKLRYNIESFDEFTDHGLPQMTVSIGVTTYTDGMGLIEMTDIADRALYTAKNTGKNQVYSLRNPDSEPLPIGAILPVGVD
jgi:diguanylate cyclase (GGDEF)-like protein